MALSDAGLQKPWQTATRHALWGMGQRLFMNCIVAAAADVNAHNMSEGLSISQPKPIRNVTESSPKARPTCSTMP